MKLDRVMEGLPCALFGAGVMLAIPLWQHAYRWMLPERPEIRIVYVTPPVEYAFRLDEYHDRGHGLSTSNAWTFCGLYIDAGSMIVTGGGKGCENLHPKPTAFTSGGFEVRGVAGIVGAKP